MTNVKTTRKGDILVLEIDISAEAIACATGSKSGKTRVVASTHGFTSIEGVNVSLNVTTKEAAPAAAVTVGAAAQSVLIKKAA